MKYFILHNGEILGMSDKALDAVNIFFDWRYCLKAGLLELHKVQFSKKGYTVEDVLIQSANLGNNS